MIPAATQVLHRLGLGSVLDAFMDAHPLKHGIRWGSDWNWRDGDHASPRLKRDAFDAALTFAAEAAGARVVRHARMPEFDGADARTIVVRATGSATWARGKPDATIVEQLPETVALTARTAVGDGPRDASIIEAVPQGWWWWLPLSDGDVLCTLVADAEEVRTASPAAVFASAVRASEGPARLLRTPAVAGRVATAWRRRSFAGWLVGDAASRLDPLSSQGIEKALASAEHVAAGLGRVFEHPEESESVRAWLDRWDAGLFAAHARRTLAYYASEERFADAPFWTRRRAAYAEREAPTRTVEPTTRLRPAKDAIGVDDYRLDDDRLVPQKAWLGRGARTAVAQLSGIAVVRWWELLADGRTVEEAVGAARMHPIFGTQSAAGVARQFAEMVRLGLVDAE